MTEIAGGRWDNLIARMFPIKGRPISPGMSPELQPVVVVQPDLPEMALLRSERIYGEGVNLAAVALQTPKWLLRNPAASTGLIIVEWLLVGTNASNANVFIRMQPLPSPVVDLANPGLPVVRDTRQSGGAATSATPGFGITSNEVSAAVAAGGPIARFRPPAGVTFPIVTDSAPIVLGPGTGMEVDTTDANILLEITCFWRERAAEPSELRGV